MKKITLLSLIGLSLLTSCSESALDKLNDDSLDSDLTPASWVKMAKDEPDNWKDALDFCKKSKENMQKPNCVAVRKAYGQMNLNQIIAAGSTKLVTEESYGSNPDNNIHSLYNYN